MSMPFEEPDVKFTTKTYSYVIYGNGKKFFARPAGFCAWMRMICGKSWMWMESRQYCEVYTACKVDAEIRSRDRKRKRLRTVSFVE